MEDKVFVYLRLRRGETEISRTKIREVAGLGSLLAEFFREAIQTGIHLSPAGGPDATPVMEYVDANTERVLVRVGIDPARRVQVIEGCIPPSYQSRMLDPDAASYSVDRLREKATEDLPPEERNEIDQRLEGPQADLLAQIREAMDAEGNFRIQLPLGR